jgi:hypothetical protein
MIPKKMTLLELCEKHLNGVEDELSTCHLTGDARKVALHITEQLYLDRCSILILLANHLGVPESAIETTYDDIRLQTTERYKIHDEKVLAEREANGNG